MKSISCMKKYFYKKLIDYLSVYILKNDKLIEVNPFTPLAHEISDKSFTINRLEICNTEQRRMPDSFHKIKEFDPDYILLNGAIHYDRDVLSLFGMLHGVCKAETRLAVSYYSRLWYPLFKLMTKLGIRAKDPEQNWISSYDLNNMLELAGFETVVDESRILIPIYIPFISDFINRYVAPLPFFRNFCVLRIMIARAKLPFPGHAPSVSIVIPARNEAGNIEKAVQDIPVMGPKDEIIFVEGNSSDNTWEVIVDVKDRYHDKKIIIAQQDGNGKGDAVRKGFSLANNEILMILDADLTVPPKSLPQFYDAVVSGAGEFINGSRLVYPMEDRAMRFANIIGNKFFAQSFSFVLGQRFKDTLCGTKVLSKQNYEKIASHRSYFGDFDPFGDFDLIFGSMRLALKIREVPIHYKERTYGDTNIQRWRHGLILLRMLGYAARKIKFV